jgi:hypothetical protein
MADRKIEMNERLFSGIAAMALGMAFTATLASPQVQGNRAAWCEWRA